MASLRPPPTDRSLEERLSFGVINLDKPPGPSSHQVAAWVRDAIGRAAEELGGDPVEKAAHAGTLDPKVTGCLPVMLGAATRLAPAFLEGNKTYVAVLELHGPLPPDAESTIAEFETEIHQKPPRKSAVTRRLRSRTVYDLDVLDRRDRRLLLRIRCESGTYVRKLCHDVGLALGTGGHMGDLRRIGTGPFEDTDLVTMYDLVDAIEFAIDGDREALESIVAPGERVLSGLSAVTIAANAAEEVAHGAPVYAPGIIDVEGTPTPDELVACYTPNGSAVCLGRLMGDPNADRGIVVELERVLV